VTTTAPIDDHPPSDVRPAERADLLAIHRIETKSFPQPWPYDAFERFLDEPAFLVATTPTGVVGYIVADVVPNHGRAIGHIKDLAVHPDHRQNGYARSLLAHALTALTDQDATTAKLEVRDTNTPAISLYTSFDFQPLRTIPRYYDNGDDAHVMVRDLHTWGR
jgi:ribosomal-protein-alanine N-acetyltransferase